MAQLNFEIKFLNILEPLITFFPSVAALSVTHNSNNTLCDEMLI